jgi:hypothetical protein
VIGQDSVARSDTNYNQRSDTTTAAASTRDATEWRVVYQCGLAAAPPPPQQQPQVDPYAPPPPPPPPPGAY